MFDKESYWILENKYECIKNCSKKLKISWVIQHFIEI